MLVCVYDRVVCVKGTVNWEKCVGENFPRRMLCKVHNWKRTTIYAFKGSYGKIPRLEQCFINKNAMNWIIVFTKDHNYVCRCSP